MFFNSNKWNLSNLTENLDFESQYTAKLNSWDVQLREMFNRRRRRE